MSRLTLIDRLTIAYLVFTLGVVLIRHERIPHGSRLFAINVGLVVVVWLLAGRRSRERSGLADALSEWYPLAFFVMFFEQIGSLVHAFVDGWYDAWLIEADRALFGVDLTVWIEQFASYWLTEVMQLAYTSYFPLTAGVAAWLWTRRGRDAFRLLMLASCVTYYTCYLVFILFPIESPYHSLRHLQQVELHGGVFTAIIERIERYGRVHGGAFPSAHVAGSVVTWLVAGRVAPVLGLCLTPLVALLMVATVYGRYHYGVDVIAGSVVGSLGYLAAVRVARSAGL
jgi:membrane-associated phospholipid phosphatase